MGLYGHTGEVSEHIDNPVDFLRSIRENMAPAPSELLLPFRMRSAYADLRVSLKNLEMINSDHRFWFTPFTLMKVVRQAGITVEGFDLCVDEKTIRFFAEILVRKRSLLTPKSGRFQSASFNMQNLISHMDIHG